MMETDDLFNEKIQEVIAHYGVKGMKWGKRKGRTDVAAHPKTSSTGKAVVKTSGGSGHPVHSDALQARMSEQKLKKSGINSLSNHELQNLQNRLNLERNVKNLTESTATGEQFIKNLLISTGKQQVQRVANQLASQQVDAALKKKK